MLGCSALKIQTSLSSRRVNLNLGECVANYSICIQVMGWMSQSCRTASMRWKEKFLKGLFLRTGFSRQIRGAFEGSSMLMMKSRQSKLMRSLKGYRPVPPATIMIFPGVRSQNLSPQPRGQLSFKDLNFLYVNTLVIVPWGQRLKRTEMQLVSEMALSLVGTARSLLLLFVDMASPKGPFSSQLMRRSILEGSRKATEVYNLVILSSALRAQYFPICAIDVQPLYSNPPSFFFNFSQQISPFLLMWCSEAQSTSIISYSMSSQRAGMYIFARGQSRRLSISNCEKWAVFWGIYLWNATHRGSDRGRSISLII